MLSFAKEHYPSRNVEEPVLIRRQDPVIWGSSNQRPRWLSESAEQEYADNGYIAFPDLIGPTEVAGLQAEVERLLDEFDGCPASNVILEPEGASVRSIFDLPTISRAFFGLARRPRLLEFSRYVLGGYVYLHQTRLNCKPGFDGREFYWHSDFETWHVEDGMPSMRAVSCLVLLTENDTINGPLLVVPGSHRTYVACVGSTPDDNHLTSLVRQTVGTPSREALSMLVELGGGVKPITGPAGTIVFFDSNILHGSNGNISPYPRRNAFMVYNSVHNRLGKPLHGLHPRPEHIAHRLRASALS